MYWINRNILLKIAQQHVQSKLALNISVVIWNLATDGVFFLICHTLWNVLDNS